MKRYVASRVLQSLITILGISLIVFALTRLSGDPVALLLPPDMSTPEERAALERRLGLNEPLPVQYMNFLRDVSTGDFGTSTRYGKPALEVFWERFPNTLKLAGVASVFALVLGVGAGVIGAIRYRGFVDRVVTFVALLGQAVPSFWIAIMMILLFSVQLGWLPTSGKGDLRTYLMPATALAWFSMASLLRLTRSSMLDVLDTDYVRLARLKGLPERTVVWKHAFRNAMIPIITMFSLQLIFFVSGSVIIESIFAWPGVGHLTVQSINARDFAVVQTVVLIMGASLVLLNLVIDLTYSLIDPRIRLS